MNTYGDCDSYSAIRNEAVFFIHFKKNDKYFLKKAFRYDWKMWTIPELVDLLNEAGFKEVDIYYEDDAGKHRLVKEKDPPYEQWVLQIVALKR